MKYFQAIFLIIIVFFSVSCQQFFTTTLAEFAVRDSYDLSKINEEQAIDLSAQAVDNRDTQLATELVSIMSSMVLDDPQNLGLLTSATQIAVLSTGVEDALMNTLGDMEITALIENPNSVASDLAANFSAVELTQDVLDVFNLMSTADPSQLAEAGITAGDYLNAALALVADELDTPENISAAINGTFPPDFELLPNIVLASSLIDAAVLTWGDDQILSSLSDFFSVL